MKKSQGFSETSIKHIIFLRASRIEVCENDALFYSNTTRIQINIKHELLSS